jgi:hypothetical protein
MNRLKQSILTELTQNKFLNKKLVVFFLFASITYFMTPNVIHILQAFGVQVPNYIAHSLAAVTSVGGVYRILAEIYVWSVPGWVLWALVAAGSALA